MIGTRPLLHNKIQDKRALKSTDQVDTSLIHMESSKSPTAVLFDVDTGRISIRHCEYKSITLNVPGKKSTRIML
ncbi:hypothetical protein Tco_1056487 [Tanacetum coccineum]|uniref:Uncharacterized protein n=1 Tax=Tanacetum coccineum TaxID=301880 RepID=A0ABQ5H2N4_9ASTR